MSHDGAFGAPADQLRKWAVSYVPPFRSWDGEAWKALASSDIGKFMGAERLVDWSAAYRTLPGLANDKMARRSHLFLVRSHRLDATVAVTTQKTRISQTHVLRFAVERELKFRESAVRRVLRAIRGHFIVHTLKPPAGG